MQNIFGTSVSAIEKDSSGIFGIVVDRSGSMATMHKELINGLNTLIADQKELVGNNTKTQVFISQFDNKVENLLKNVPLNQVPIFDEKNFIPRGMTALLDGIYHMVQQISEEMERKKDQNLAPPIIVIMTDGEENSSTVSHPEVLRLITEKKTLGWKFTFMGCSANAIEIGKCMGFDKERCLNYQPNGPSQSNAWRAVSAQVSRTMSHPNDDTSAGFTDAERFSVQTS